MTGDGPRPPHIPRGSGAGGRRREGAAEDVAAEAEATAVALAAATEVCTLNRVCPSPVNGTLPIRTTDRPSLERVGQVCSHYRLVWP